jgi:EpsD family peptidyl-prolyl cis-trans isomerase
MLAICVCLTLGGCHIPWLHRHSAPTGQVVATIDGEEVTVRELDAEMAGVNVSDPKQRKAIQDQALKAILTRKALAKAARDQGIEKTADFALQRERTIDAMLAQALQSQTAAAVPAPSPEEVARFVSDHPELFEQRKVFLVDQIRAPRPSDPNRLKELEPLNTLDQVADLFNRENIQFARGESQLDAAALGPTFTAAILKLPEGELFVLPSGNSILVNQIRDTKIVPLTGDDANKVATQYLRQQHVKEAVSRAMQAILTKAAPTIQYNPAYRPSVSPHTPSSAGATPSASASPPPGRDAMIKGP